MSRRWNDFSNESLFSAGSNENKGLHHSLNFNDVSLSAHMPPTHTHELENSKSGLNILLRKTILGNAYASVSEESEIKSGLFCEDKVRTVSVKGTLEHSAEKQKRLAWNCKETLLEVSYEESVVVAHSATDEENEDLLKIKMRETAAVEKSILDASSSKSGRKVRLRDFGPLRKHLGELSSLTPAKRLLDESPKAESPVVTTEVLPQASVTSDEKIETQETSQAQTHEMAKVFRNKKKRRKADSRKHAFRDSVPEQWLGHTSEASTADKRPKKTKSHRNSTGGMQAFYMPGGINQAGKAAAIPLYYTSSFDYIPALIPAIVDAGFLANTPLHGMSGMHAHPMTAKVIGTPNYSTLHTPALPQLEDSDVAEKSEIGANSKETKAEEVSKKRLESRFKEIAVGKATVGYRNYLRSIPKDKRTELDPVTPNPQEKLSASEFKVKCHLWRRSLHRYDS